MQVGRSISTAIATHSGLDTGVHGVGALYVALAAIAGMEAVDRSGDSGLGRIFGRGALDDYLEIRGGIGVGARIQLYGQDQIATPGRITLETSNAAKDGRVVAARWSGGVDNPEMIDGRVPRARIPDFAHGATHVDGQPDEFSVAGLSGVLADDQTPATHDVGKHQSVNRTLPLIPFLFGTGEAANIGYYRSYKLDAATEYGQASFQIPVGFVSLISAHVAIIPITTGTFDWTANAEELDAGGVVGSDGDTDTDNAVAGTNNTLLELELTSALDGLTLAVGDWVGVQFILDALATITELHLVGLEICLEMDE